MINTETDYTGLSENHTIVDERLNLNPVSINHHNFVIPAFSPFYVKRRDGERVYLIHEDSGRTLVENIDFQFTNKHLELSRYTQTELYGSITFRDRGLSGIVRIPEYQTVGFPWTLDEATIATQLANIAENPRTASFEQVYGMPASVPPLLHSVDLEDLKGLEHLIEAIGLITKAIDEKVLDFSTFFMNYKSELLGEDPVHEYRNISLIGKFLETIPTHSVLNEERLLAVSQSEDVAYKFAGQPYLDFNFVESSNSLADYTQGVYPVSCDVSGNRIVIGCTMGYVITSVDGGLTWRSDRLDFEIQQETITAVCLDGDRAVIGSSMGKIRYSLDGLGTWLKSNNTIGSKINDIRYCDMGLGIWILIAENGEIRRSTNIGLSWSNDYGFASNVRLKAIASEVNNLIFIATEEGDVYRSTDGLLFSKLGTSFEDTIESIEYKSGRLFVCLNDGRLANSNDSGNTFSYMSIPLLEIRSCTGLEDGRIMVVGVNAVDGIVRKYEDRRRVPVRGLTAMRSLDDGKSWGYVDTGILNPQLLDVASDGGIWVTVGYAGNESVISLSRT